MTIQMKAIEQYFHVALCIILMVNTVVLTFKSVDEILVCVTIEQIKPFCSFSYPSDILNELKLLYVLKFLFNY